MGDAPDPSMPESMYSTRAEETLCILADSNGLAIRLLDEDAGRYQINEGVTGWSGGRIVEWVNDALSIHDHRTKLLESGGVEVTVEE